MIKRLLVTGYKAHELGIFNKKHKGIVIIKKALEKYLVQYAEEELEWVIISGQLGVELWAAEIILELKIDFPKLKLAILPPFEEHEKNWNEDNQEYYHSIRDRADYVNVISKRPYVGPWQFKASTAFLLDHTDALLLIYDEEKEGSPKYIFEDAKKRNDQEGYPYFQINAYDLQAIAEEVHYEDNM